MYEENFCIRRIKELMENNHFNAYRLASKAGISLSTLTSMFDKNTFFERSSKDLTEDQEYLLESYERLSPSAKKHLISYLNFLSQDEPNSLKN